MATIGILFSLARGQPWLLLLQPWLCSWGQICNLTGWAAPFELPGSEAMRAWASLKRLEEGEAAHVAAQERMQAQLHSAVREAKVAKSKAAADVSELASKLHRTRKQWGREKAAMRLVEDKGARRADSLRRENIRNRAEGEKLRAERDAARRGATLSMLSAAGELPADLQTLIASDTALADELKQMKAKAESLQQ